MDEPSDLGLLDAEQGAMELVAGNAQRGEERDSDHRPQEPVEVAQAVASLRRDPTKAGSKEEARPEDRQARKRDGECGIA